MFEVTAVNRSQFSETPRKIIMYRLAHDPFDSHHIFLKTRPWLDLCASFHLVLDLCLSESGHYPKKWLKIINKAVTQQMYQRIPRNVNRSDVYDIP